MKAKRYQAGTLICVDKLIYEVLRNEGDCVIFRRKGREFVSTASWLSYMVTDAILPATRLASSTG